MVNFQDIENVCQQIVEQFHPEKVILFGSYAYGKPNPDSDVDLLVVLPFDGRPSDKCFEIRKAVRHKFPLDVLVRTPQMIRERLAIEDYFVREIVDKGKVLYEASDGGMDRKG
jgi:uncharacterized protein